MPFRLVAGLVRNEKEAAALVQLDVLSMQAEAIQEHLAAAACYDFALCKTAVSLATETADQPVSTNTALSLLLTGLRSVRSAELRLLVRAAAVESKVRDDGHSTCPLHLHSTPLHRTPLHSGKWSMPRPELRAGTVPGERSGDSAARTCQRQPRHGVRAGGRGRVRRAGCPEAKALARRRESVPPDPAAAGGRGGLSRPGWQCAFPSSAPP